MEYGIYYKQLSEKIRKIFKWTKYVIFKCYNVVVDINIYEIGKNVMEKDKKREENTVESSGLTYSNVSIGETTYEMNKFHSKQGHGFAAERAEHIHDLYHGEEVQILGDDNAKNGADRLLNGTELQSKYCRSGADCIRECFENGKYRYYSKNGQPMQVEVPYDMYDGAVEAMKRRISNGEVDGVSNPNDAEKLVKRGNYTYAQVKQIAQAGTIESLSFDAANGMIIAKDAMSITAVVTFAISLWNGEDMDIALENAVLSGLKVGGVSFLTTVITSQIARTSIHTSIRVGTDFVVSKLGTKVTSYIANSLRNGTNIYGAAAMKNVSKLLTGNIIANTVSLVVLSMGDIVALFRGRISTEQFIKDVSVTGATIAGGSGGWIAGNALGGTLGGAIGGALTGGTGTVAGAKIGSKVGGFIGSMTGGTVTGQATKTVLDELIEDDAVKILWIVECEFASICEQYLLTENEVHEALTLLKEKLTKSVLRDIYASDNQELYAQKIILDCINPILHKRQYINDIRQQDMMKAVRFLMEDAIEGTGVFDNREILPSYMDIQQHIPKEMNIQENQIHQIMQPVLQMNRTQQRTERTLVNMKRNNEDTHFIRKQLYEERQEYQKELELLLKK